MEVYNIVYLALPINHCSSSYKKKSIDLQIENTGEDVPCCLVMLDMEGGMKVLETLQKEAAATKRKMLVCYSFIYERFQLAPFLFQEAERANLKGENERMI
jgi:hypothetical protein